MPTVIHSGRIEKKAINLTVKFPVLFTTLPHVVITGHWDASGQRGSIPGGVERPDIIHAITNSSFTVHSENRTPTNGATYFIHWMARGNVP